MAVTFETRLRAASYMKLPGGKRTYFYYNNTKWGIHVCTHVCICVHVCVRVYVYVMCMCLHVLVVCMRVCECMRLYLHTITLDESHL